MWRVTIESFLLFSSPFLLYAAFHLLQRRWPFISEFWSRSVVSSLAIIGLVFVVVGILTLGLGARHEGTYVPAHIENGRLAPGRFE